jgi:hypothetical protein
MPIKFFQVYRHPFFWGPRLRLTFIRSLSDFLERYVLHTRFDFLYTQVTNAYVNSVSCCSHSLADSPHPINLLLLLKLSVVVFSTKRTSSQRFLMSSVYLVLCRWDTQIDPTLMSNLGGHRKCDMRSGQLSERFMLIFISGTILLCFAI